VCAAVAAAAAVARLCALAGGRDPLGPGGLRARMGISMHVGGC
jgi:hypothetical protein